MKANAIVLQSWNHNIYLGYACACNGLLIERSIHLHIQQVSQRMGLTFGNRGIEVRLQHWNQLKAKEMDSTTSSGLFWKSRWNTFSTSCCIYEATIVIKDASFSELVVSEKSYITSKDAWGALSRSNLKWWRYLMALMDIVMRKSWIVNKIGYTIPCAVRHRRRTLEARREPSLLPAKRQHMNHEKRW